MEGSSSSVRRRAWINSCRQRPTAEEHEGSLCIPASASIDDDVFSDGKIENWFLGWGSDGTSKKNGQFSFDSVSQTNAFFDDLSLGADAFVLSDAEVGPQTGFQPRYSFEQQRSGLTSSTPSQKQCQSSVNLGHSMSSSCLSSSTLKTMSSVSEVLRLYTEDAEETLYELGFGSEEPQVTVRIPPRFFTFPSQAKGINFRLFLDSQIRRIHEEDPSLSLASRFRQVQVLTTMVNAFYSLYSHVSRTPLQKLVTPEFSFSSPLEKMERFRTSVRSEPRSPVERLKDTVNKMCLYTGSPRGSDSTSPRPLHRKRSSLPDVVDFVLKAKTGPAKKLIMGEHNRSHSSTDIRLITDGQEMKEIEKLRIDAEILLDGDNVRQKMQESEQNDNTDTIENICRQTDFDCANNDVRASLTSSLSEETVIETEHFLPTCQTELDLCVTQSERWPVKHNPISTVSYDLICPEITDKTHQEPFCCLSKQSTNCSLFISSVRKHKYGSHATSHETSKQNTISDHEGNPLPQDVASPEDSSQEDGFKSLAVLEPSGGYGHYYITVTGLEGEESSLCSINTADTSPSSSDLVMKTCEPFKEGEKQCLNPRTYPGLGHSSNNLQHVNSFELEEVHSAGEEDFGQSEAARQFISQSKGEVVRNDSIQSDSSGYADEEVSPSVAERLSR